MCMVKSAATVHAYQLGMQLKNIVKSETLREVEKYEVTNMITEEKIRINYRFSIDKKTKP